MQAREYTKVTHREHTGYVECLRRMRSDFLEGKDIDFSDWQEARCLMTLNEESLSLLLNMYKDFCGRKLKKAFRLDAKDIKSRPRHSLYFPEIDQNKDVLWSWIEEYLEDHKIKEKEYLQFVNAIRDLAKNRFDIEDSKKCRYIYKICTKWQNREITKKEAVEKLGLTPSLFNRILQLAGIERNKEPKYFDIFYTAWQKDIISKKEAMAYCGMCETYFNQCMRERQKRETEEKENSE